MLVFEVQAYEWVVPENAVTHVLTVTECCSLRWCPEPKNQTPVYTDIIWTGKVSLMGAFSAAAVKDLASWLLKPLAQSRVRSRSPCHLECEAARRSRRIRPETCSQLASGSCTNESQGGVWDSHNHWLDLGEKLRLSHGPYTKKEISPLLLTSDFLGGS